jgi:hypothetical protein
VNGNCREESIWNPSDQSDRAKVEAPREGGGGEGEDAFVALLGLGRTSDSFHFIQVQVDPKHPWA